MKTFVAILYLSFSSAVLLGQTPSRDEASPPVRNPVMDRLQRLSKTFPPDRNAGDVLEWLKAKGPGHLTRINDILTTIMEAERRVKKSA